VRYQAPEQLSGKKLTCQTDAYHWALTLFEILTKEKPLSDIDDVEELKKCIIEGARISIPEYICPYISDILNRCWREISQRITVKDILKIDFESDIFKENYKFSFTYWGSIWEKISEDYDELDWGTFIKNFCQFFQFSINLKSYDYDCLKFAFTSSSKVGKVTKDDFSFAYYWITDALYPGWSIAKSIANNVGLNWFFINATTQDEGKFVNKRHQFMVRFSQKNDSLVIVYIKTKGKSKKKQYKHNKIANPYILYKRVKRAQKKHSLKPISYKKTFPEIKEGKIELNRELKSIPGNAQIIY